MKLNQKRFSNRWLLASFAITLLLFAIFIVVPLALGFPTLDSTASPAVARSQIALMTPPLRHYHVALTTIIDCLFPLSYGYFFAGIALRFWGRLAPFVCVAVAILVATDLLENVVQIIALTGWGDLLDAKSFLTPLKFSLFIGGWVMTVFTIPLGIIQITRKI